MRTGADDYLSVILRAIDDKLRPKTEKEKKKKRPPPEWVRRASAAIPPGAPGSLRARIAAALNTFRMRVFILSLILLRSALDLCSFVGCDV